MKDRQKEKAVEQFNSTLQDLKNGIDAIEGDVLDWGSIFTDDPIAYWYAQMRLPLKQKAAKWEKAVTSILEKSACVTHALKYKDIPTLECSSEIFRGLRLSSLVGTQGCLSWDNQNLLWEYFDELTECCNRVYRVSAVRIPQFKEISDDIAKRKKERTTVSENTAMHNGMYDLACSMFTNNGLATAPSKVEFETLVAEHMGCKIIDCKSRNADSVALFTSLFPDIARKRGGLTNDDWKTFDKIIAMHTVDNSIPKNMMRGIEDVANQLMLDIRSGNINDLNFDAEGIGKRVLSTVSTSDITNFAGNIDKILPAITNMDILPSGILPIPHPTDEDQTN